MQPFALDPRTSAALREYWRFYAARTDVVMRDLRRAIATMPELAGLRAILFTEQIASRDGILYKLQHDAIVDDRWEPLLEYFTTRGEQLAMSGVTYSAWYDFTIAFRDVIREHARMGLHEDVEANLRLASAVSDGLNALLDLTVRRVTAAYVATKERLVVRAEERHRAVFDHNPLAMWVYDRSSLEIIAANDAASRLHDYPPGGLSGRSLADLWPSTEPDDVHAKIAETEGHVAPVWQHRRRDGSVFTVEVRGTDLSFQGREGRMCVLQDVTQRESDLRALRVAEDQLRHAQKIDALGRFAGDIAHDFANMLTVIESYAWTLEDSFDASDTRAGEAGAIRKAAERATDLTRQLMSLSRHNVSAPRAVELDSVIDGFMPMLRRLVGASISIDVHKGGSTTVLADPGQLEQLVMNLAVNARDAMPEGGRLTVETSLVALDSAAAAARSLAEGHYVVLAVTDTGTGMDADTQRRIFEPFFTTKPEGRGTGLGLAIVHGIVSRARGSIAVHSKLGHGTTFRVYFAAEEPAEPVVESSAMAAATTLPAMTVLVVDDDADVRTVTSRTLQDLGCRVIEAATAEEARITCVTREEMIHLAIVDAALPDGGGEALAQNLVHIRPSLRILVVSGYAATTLRLTHPFLAKPFTPGELRNAVASAIARPESAADPVVTRSRVLVADDDANLRRMIVRVLRREGFDVVDVDSGRAAESQLANTSFDVVVSDVHMPDGDGVSLLRSVRRFDLDVPVILVSGKPDLGSATNAIEYGAFRYVTKPIEPDELTALVRRAARAHALARLRRDATAIGGFGAGAVDRAGLEVRFDQAIEGLWMAFQPIVDAHTGARFAVEALVRSDEPSMSSPKDLFAAATELGRLPLLTRRIRSITVPAIALRDDLTLFLNVHPDDLMDIELVDETAPLAAISRRVVLEVTERAPLILTGDLIGRLERLRRLGFRIAVDDIGAGYNGLSTFTELAPEFVKIDMSLVRDVHKSPRKQRTISAIASLCHEVGCSVIAEGVETEPERVLLSQLGCDYLQGYLLGRPSREF